MSPRRDRPDPDPRHAEVKAALARYWEAENPDLPDLPWSGADAGALAALLRANPKLDAATIEICLHHRLQSEDHAPAERVCRWILDILRYRSGALDRFRLPKRIGGEATVGYLRLTDPGADPTAPFCDVCGALMTREADGWKCLRCGRTLSARAWFIERAKRRLEKP